MLLEFFIPGEPVAWARVQGGRTTHVFEPKKQRDYRPHIRLAASRAMEGRSPLESALAISATFIFPRPKSHFWTGKRSNILRDDAPRLHVSRPDTSNLVKLIEDALNGVVWRDDSQIAVYERIEKVYGEIPGVRVKIVGGLS